MNKTLKLIYLILILTLSYSCVESQAAEKEIIPFERFKTSQTDSLKFTSGIRAIFQDSKGNYWIGSQQEGVSVYDGKTFIYISAEDGLAGNQLRSFQEDQNGTIWLETDGGVSSYDGEHIQQHTVNGISASEWSKKENDLWFNAGTKQGVYQYDGKNLNYLAFPNPKPMSSGNVYAVTGHSEGKNNMLWLGTYAGVFGYNGKEITTINDETLNITENSEKMHVRSILEDSKGRLWIGNNGIGVMLKNGDAISNFSKEQGKLMPMKEFEANTLTKQTNKNTGLQSVFAIAEDHQGNIWFGDRDTGVWKYDGKTLTNYKVNEKLSTQMVVSIYEDQKNNLLVGMAAGGVYKFNGKAFDHYF